MDKKLYRYYCPMREPAPGAIPKDGLVKSIDFGARTHVWYLDLIDIEVYGVVTYNRKLSTDEICNYELLMTTNRR